MSELNRLRWRCRRGMLELDVLLGRFLAERYAALTPPQQVAFAELVECQDQQLWDWCYHGKESGNPYWDEVLHLLRGWKAGG